MKKSALTTVGLLLLLATACDDQQGPSPCNPEYCPAGCVDGRCPEPEYVLEGHGRPPLDLLFVVDNSSSMCEEQASLLEASKLFLETVASFGIDFHIAVVTTDMVDTLGGVGRFRTRPGSYQDNISRCSVSAPELSYCDELSLTPYLSSEDYREAQSLQLDAAMLQRDFACMAMTGIDGDGVEMGLETMSRALTSGVNPPDFLRRGSILAIVFVSDENDCSDNTFGQVPGEVYSTGDAGCEYNRNIEDSCLYARDDNDGLLNEGPMLSYGDERKSARQWCSEGDPVAVSALQDSLELLCPSGGCTNKLKTRRSYYNAITELVARRDGLCKEGAATCEVDNQSSWQTADAADLDLALAAQNVIVATIINPDRGRRFLETEEIDGAVCGDAGTAGYRYQLFAEMFPVNRRIVFPICENDLPTSFAQALEEITTVVGKSIDSICLRWRPATCDTDEDCPTGESCAETEYLAGTDYAFRLCSGFAVTIESELSDGSRVPLVEGVDFKVNYTQCSYISPLGLEFLNPLPGGARWIISYPRAQ
ncbi:MAG: hypothetical protein RBU37_00265 [Myxococcota bacterium]|jgi:hypothetical protein|nr:hypothetical protein [Myxococcota bacterium]